MNRNTWTLLAVIALDLIGFGIVLPLMPFIAQNLGANAFEVGVLASAYPIIQLLFVPFWGYLSDRMGAKPILIASTLGGALAYVLFALAKRYELLLLSRALAGMMAANLGVARAYLARESNPSQLHRKMGLLGVAQAVGFLLGPLLGTALYSLSASAPAWGAAGICILACAGVLVWFVPDGGVERSSATFLDSLKETLKSRPLLLANGVLFLVTLAFSELFIAFPLLIQTRFGFGGIETARYFVELAVLAIVFQGLLYPAVVKRVREVPLLSVSLVGMIAALLLLPQNRTPLQTAVCLALYVLGSSFSTPVLLATVARYSPSERQGMSAGLSESVTGLARAIGPALAGLLIQRYGIGSAYAFGAALLVLAFLKLVPLSGESLFQAE